MIKFIHNLATMCAPFRPLPNQLRSTNGEQNKTKHLESLKKAIKEVTQNAHFNENCKTRVTCDASKSGPGAVLEQQQAGQWVPIAYASKFLNTAEEKYSINELELL